MEQIKTSADLTVLAEAFMNNLYHIPNLNSISEMNYLSVIENILRMQVEIENQKSQN